MDVGQTVVRVCLKFRRTKIVRPSHCPSCPSGPDNVRGQSEINIYPNEYCSQIPLISSTAASGRPPPPMRCLSTPSLPPARSILAMVKSYPTLFELCCPTASDLLSVRLSPAELRLAAEEAALLPRREAAVATAALVPPTPGAGQARPLEAQPRPAGQPPVPPLQRPPRPLPHRRHFLRLNSADMLRPPPPSPSPRRSLSSSSGLSGATPSRSSTPQE